MRSFSTIILGIFVFLSSQALTEEASPQAAREKASPLEGAQWIWTSPEGLADTAIAYFRLKFNLDRVPEKAIFWITADNGYELHINRRLFARELSYSGSAWGTVEQFHIEDRLLEGANVIAVQGRSLGGSAGVVATLEMHFPGGEVERIVTDERWLATKEADENWTEADHDDSLWKPAAVLGPARGTAPWSNLSIAASPSDPKKLVFDASVPGGPPVVVDRFTEPGEHFRWPEAVVFITGQGPIHSTKAATTKFSIPGTESYYEYDTPAPAVSGRKMYFAQGTGPEAKISLLVDAGEGLVASPNVSFQGDRVVFAMVPEGTKFYHLYEMPLAGGEIRQLTDGPWHDYDPEYLPDGRIVFASSRTGSRDEYHANTARSLFTVSPEGEIEPLTYHIVADAQPTLMTDGRIAMVRHDNFMERAKVETRIHAVRSDGTGGQTIIGPDRGAIRYDRPTGAEHPYNWLRNYGFGSPAPLADGRIACLSNRGPLVADVLLRGKVDHHRMPSEVSLFDIAPLPDGRLLCTTRKYQFGVLDPSTGKCVALFPGVDPRDSTQHSIVHASRRPKPHSLAGTLEEQAVDDFHKSGFLYCNDIRNTQQIEGDWDRVTAVRVLQGKPVTLRAALHQYGHVGVEAVELGTVPLAEDGSFYLEVPADRALALQAVDAEGRAVVNEMSWIYVRPGEQRACTGCHNFRQEAPDYDRAVPVATLQSPADLTGSRAPIRFRGNNAANGGVLNQQFDRFREVAALNSYRLEELPNDFEPHRLPSGRAMELRTWSERLHDPDPGMRIAALQRLAMLRDRMSAGSVVPLLQDPVDTVRMNACVTLSTCGTPETWQPLLDALNDDSPVVARAAAVAVEHLSGLDVPPIPSADDPEFEQRKKALTAWSRAEANPPWPEIIDRQMARLRSGDLVEAQLAAETLGHIGNEAAKTALREFLVSERALGSLTARLAAIRALGHLRDEKAVPLLGDLLHQSGLKKQVKAEKSHEFGWTAMPDHLGGAAAEALGRIGTPTCESMLIDQFDQLAEFWFYTFRTADHNWLMGSHSSIIHFRIAESLERMASGKTAPITDKLLLSVPIDSDRGIFFENDAYETVIARLIQRSGRADAVVETCLDVLGDPNAKPDEALRHACTFSPPAVSTGVLSAESRAAHLLSVVARRPKWSDRVRETLTRYRQKEPGRVRSWVGFMLLRTLGTLEDPQSMSLCRRILDEEVPEMVRDVPEPPNVFLHNVMTPSYRAAAAWVLGKIGDPQSAPTLLRAVATHENTMEVKQAAAVALGELGDPSLLPEMERLARGYPEIATARSLREACVKLRRLEQR